MHSNSGRRRVLLLVGLLHKVIIVQKRGERRVARAELLIDHVADRDTVSRALNVITV